MYAGKIVEEGPAHQVFTAARHPYAEALAWAFPVIGDERSRLSPRGLGGDCPDPADVPSGCSFHPRCAVAEPECSLVHTQLWPAGPGRVCRLHPGTTGRRCGVPGNSRKK